MHMYIRSGSNILIGSFFEVKLAQKIFFFLLPGKNCSNLSSLRSIFLKFQLIMILANLVLFGTNIVSEATVTASCYRSLNTLTEVEEPAGIGESLGTGAHRHRSILPPGVKYVPGPRVLRRILSNRS